MKPLIKQLVQDESGQDLIEYVLVSAVICLGCIAAIGGIANPIVNAVNSVTSNFVSGI